jgi:hypothetical protein
VRFPASLLLVLTAACAVRTVEYREDPPPPVAVAAAPLCSPDYPCANNYYWDEWREVYVFYDGYRYIDCTGLPGGYPLPPVGVLYTAPPRGYIPPSSWMPPRGTYRPPVGYVRRGTPAPYLVEAPPPAGQRYGFSGPPANAGGVVVAPPPPGAGTGVSVAPPPPSSGYVAPGAGHAYVAPAGVAPPPPPPPANVYVAPSGGYARRYEGQGREGTRGGFEVNTAPNPPPSRQYEGQPRDYGRGVMAPPAAMAPAAPTRQYEGQPRAYGASPQNPNNRKPPAPPAPVRAAPQAAPSGHVAPNAR